MSDAPTPSEGSTAAAEPIHVEAAKPTPIGPAPIKVDAPKTPEPKWEDRLLDAALECFEHQGWEPFSMEDIARRVDHSAVEVLQKFPSRAHLVAGVYNRLLHQMIEDFAEELAGHYDPRAGGEVTLHNRLFGMIDSELRHLGRHKLFVHESILDLVNPISASIQAPQMVRFLALVEDQIRAARVRHEIDWWVVPSLAAAAFGVLHARVIAFWLKDRSHHHRVTLGKADEWIAGFVRLLGARTQRRSHGGRGHEADLHLHDRNDLRSGVAPSADPRKK